MKIAIAALVFALFSVAAVAQNVSINTLIKINAMKPDEVQQYFNSVKQFELYAANNKDGQVITQYKNKLADTSKQEVVSTGAYSRNQTGEVLHQISYWTNYYWFIEGLRKQAEKAGYNLRVMGRDKTRNIWCYENDEFTVNFYINKDDRQGTVVINQKHAPHQEAF